MVAFEELEKINKDFAVTPFADALEIDFMKEGVPLFDDLTPVLYHKKSDLIRVKNILVDILRNFEENLEDEAVQYHTDNWYENWGYPDFGNPWTRYRYQLKRLRELYTVINFKFSIKGRIYLLKDSVYPDWSKTASKLVCKFYSLIRKTPKIGYFDLIKEAEKMKWGDALEAAAVLEALIEYDYIKRVAPSKPTLPKSPPKDYWEILIDTGWDYEQL